MKIKFKLFVLLLIVILTGCSTTEEDIKVDHNENNNQTELKSSEFYQVTDGLAGSDELLASENTTIYIKYQESGFPDYMIILVNTPEFDDFFHYVKFNEKGLPSYMNLNNQQVYVENIRGNKYDLKVINEDGTFFTLEDIEAEINFETYWQQNAVRSTATQSRGQNAMCLVNHALGMGEMVIGGATMLVGVAMLVPGVNVAVGATLLIAGAATFVSGALTTTRATDRLVSDGSHTEGFDTAATLLGFLGAGAGAAANAEEKTLTHFLTDLLVGPTVDGIDNAATAYFDRTADFAEIREKVQGLVDQRLYTGEVLYLKPGEREVSLSGSISDKIISKDKIGIMISTDPDALYVNDCQISDQNSGKFAVNFKGLQPGTDYYYRAYYFSSELNNYFITKQRHFVMPGVFTGNYKINDDQSCDFNLVAKFDENVSDVEIGICYHPDDSDVTIETGETVSKKVDSEGEYTLKSSYLNKNHYFYRSFLKVGDDVLYGAVNEIKSDESDLLVRFYNETNGDNWTNNENWCSLSPIDEWFGVSSELYFGSYQNDFSGINIVKKIILPGNNLSGTPTIYGFSNMEEMNISGNNFSSLTFKDCLKIEKINISDCKGMSDLTFINSNLQNFEVSGNSMQKLKIDHSKIPEVDYNTRDWECDFNNLSSLSLVEIKNSSINRNLNLNNCPNLRTVLIEDCDMQFGSVNMKGDNISSFIIRNCKNFDPGYDFNGFEGGRFDYVLIERCMEEFGQHFFDGEDFYVKRFEIKNVNNLGRIIFHKGQIEELVLENVHFESQGIYPYFGSNISKIILNNFSLGSHFGEAGSDIYMSNGRIDEWFAMEGFYHISNCTIEGFYISYFTGDSYAVGEYLRKLREGK